ncbi:MAG: hypothetical protein IJS60_07975 [Abditibacteriota bacterium]|nr:hypothetical protein [Abditibacteriota bacterium]
MKKYILIFVAILVAFSIVCEAQIDTTLRITNNKEKENYKSIAPESEIKLAEGVLRSHYRFNLETQEKIVEIVRKFIGNDNLSGIEIDVIDDHTGVIKPNICEVRLKDSRIFIDVDLNYNIITHYYNLNVEEQKGNSKYSQKECRNIAIDWLNSKGYTLINQVISSEMKDSQMNRWEFYLSSKRNTELNGIDNAGGILIEVNSVTGEIILFNFFIRNYKLISDRHVSNDEITDIVKSFFTEEEIKDCNIMFNTSNKIYLRQVFAEHIGEQKVVISCICQGVPNSKYDIGLKVHKILSSTSKDIPEYAIWACEFVFDPFNKYLYQVTDFFNPLAYQYPWSISFLPEDIRKRVFEYKKSIEIVPQPEFKEVPYEFLTDEKLKELKPTTEEIETVLFKDNSDRVKFNKETCGIKDLTKFENSSDIWTVNKDNKTYIFREGSPWCLVDNKAVLVSKCELLGK